MKKKNVLIILSVILAICVGIGAYQILSPQKIDNKNETSTTIVEETTKELRKTTTEKENIVEDTSNSTKKGTESTSKKQAKASGSTDSEQKETSKSSSTNSSATTTTITTASTTTATTTTTTTTQSQSVNIKLSITCKNIDKADILSSINITMSQGDSVFDATKKICNSKGISLTYQSVYYIQGIGGVMEKDYGTTSGWMYRVNGIAPNKSAYNYKLNDGDIIEWYYVTSPSDR